jgi:hypothetical protein
VDENGQSFDFNSTEIKEYTQIYATFDSDEAILLP